MLMIVLVAIAIAVAALGLGITVGFRLRPSAPGTSLSPNRDAVQRAETLERAQVLTDEILERMSEGVLVVDESLTPIIANRAARKLLGLGDGALAPRLPTADFVSLARRAVVDRTPVEETYDLRFPQKASVRVAASQLVQGGAVLVFRDVTDEQRAHRIRRQFVTHASHELKTPIAGIQALGEAIRDASINDPDKARDFSVRLVSETERLGRLVSDLLDLSRLEDPGTISSTLTNLSDVANLEVQEEMHAATSKGVSLSSAVSPDVYIRGDGAQLGLMIRNLLDNAIRYTADEGEVAISVCSEADEAIVSVTDNGIGIPMRDQARVFERFYRVDKGRSRDRGGTGLGLAIVKHVADLHGGHVSVNSELGEGSTFVVRLPLATSASANGHDNGIPAEV
ncbi:MAG: two-component system, OmpR family, sensor histidine kinase SenX3 [Actinomycetota bacterium]|nr:two-component system, OmpR family, sensor histidine kinase SenX3 [Actinomycetota bacterium]